MRALFDVNFVIALLQPDHMHHERAHEWWHGHAAQGWASCPLTENGFLRIVSSPGYYRPVPIAWAREVFAGQSVNTDHAFWPDDVSLVDQNVFDHSRILGPKQLTNVYLLALAVKNGGRLVTLDRNIPVQAVRHAEPSNIVVV